MRSWRGDTRRGRVTAALSAAVAGAAVLASAAGCGPQRTEPNARGCDDSVEPTEPVPRALREGGMRGVGTGDVWFVVPRAARWGELLEPRVTGASGKYPLWVGGSHLPKVTVEGVHGTGGTGKADLKPTTTAGLPGPVPMASTSPGRAAGGCGHRDGRGP